MEKETPSENKRQTPQTFPLISYNDNDKNKTKKDLLILILLKKLIQRS